MFQSTHSRGVRRSIDLLFASFLFVSIHALTRSATSYYKGNNCYESFNPRTHEECDIKVHIFTDLRLSFNPRTHEECDNCQRFSRLGISSFNPRTHEECDLIYLCSKMLVKVSIHALTRSATQQSVNSYFGLMFQSTHSRGVRRNLLLSPALRCQGFNPRTHEECDLIYLPYPIVLLCFNPRTHEECDYILRFILLVIQVSIHALTRSATQYRLRLSGFRLFQSTHSRGVRQAWYLKNASRVASFNPRTHEECDKKGVNSNLPIHCFNPRTHEECDCMPNALATVPCLFQSTHSRGVRQLNHIILNHVNLFQSTHSRGVRRII